MALVCGRRRSYFHDDNVTQTIPLFKRQHYSSQLLKTPTPQPKPIQTVPTLEPNEPQTGSEWVEFLVKEMLGARSLDDAKSRTEKVLEKLREKISGRAREETLKSVAEEKEKVVEVLSKENSVLKKGVAIQHEKWKEFEAKEREFKSLVCGYEERIKRLEVNNYALSMHLNQALNGGSNSLNGFNYNRDVL